MKTDDLIGALSADRASATPLGRLWTVALCGVAVIAAAGFFVMLGPRPDIADAMQSTRFLFKFVVTVALALSAWVAARRLSRPDATPSTVLPWLVVAPALLVCALLLEMVVLPMDQWPSRLVGKNYVLCLTFIPLIGMGPLAVCLAALRHGAPTRPTLAGAVAGVLAGGVAATCYAAHCTDDSPLFVATWYTLAITLLAVIGALGGRLLVRW